MFNKIFDDFLNNIDGFDSFFKSRNNFSSNNKLVYGEFNIKSCSDSINILKDFCKLDKTEKVLDMGSGIGKIVIAMHHTDMFKDVDGVEIIPDLTDDSRKIIKLYGNKFKKNISNIHIYNQDSLTLDIKDYDIIFSNTTVDDDFRKKLIDKISNEAKNGCIVITSISAFTSDKLKLVRKFNSNFSWGDSCINASIKIG